MGDVVAFRKHTEESKGNGAREALIRYLGSIFPNQSRDNLCNVCDHQLTYLWGEGFKIVPVHPAPVAVPASPLVLTRAETMESSGLLDPLDIA